MSRRGWMFQRAQVPTMASRQAAEELAPTAELQAKAEQVTETLDLMTKLQQSEQALMCERNRADELDRRCVGLEQRNAKLTASLDGVRTLMNMPKTAGVN